MTSSRATTSSPTRLRSRSPSCARTRPPCRTRERLDWSPARACLGGHRQLGLCPRAKRGCSPLHHLAEPPARRSPRARAHEGMAHRLRRGDRQLARLLHRVATRATCTCPERGGIRCRRARTAASPRPPASPHARQAGGDRHSHARARAAGDLVDRLTSERPNALGRIDLCLARSVARDRTRPDVGTTAPRTSRDVGARCRAPVRRGRRGHETAGGRRDLARRRRAADRRVRARIAHLAERLSRRRSVGDGGHRLACVQRGADRGRHRALPPGPAPGAAARDPAARLRSRRRQRSVARPQARPCTPSGSRAAETSRHVWLEPIPPPARVCGGRGGRRSDAMTEAEANSVQRQRGRSGFTTDTNHPLPQWPMAHVRREPAEVSASEPTTAVAADGTERDDAVLQLAGALRTTERAHRAYRAELELGDVEPAEDWSTWYAEYLLGLR